MYILAHLYYISNTGRVNLLLNSALGSESFYGIACVKTCVSGEKHRVPLRKY